MLHKKSPGNCDSCVTDICACNKQDPFVCKGLNQILQILIFKPLKCYFMSGNALLSVG